ncbi:DUF6603 domain-containing protein [Halorientalis pallida]|uniref:DUF6603 domain-containing protein n=1 Tax=Halorientalis pallida TaxID=2479928 RepID=A0A498KUK9_9EURY|nr:DUF6603 domain-containing protein [Halorientalis pallida]RXK48652.1 hypothetical protein EAF64_13340 [Halorientalis pallida]
MSNGSEGDGAEKNSEAQAIVEVLKVVEPVVSATKRGPMGMAMLLDNMGVSEELIGQDAAKLYETVESDVTTNGAKIETAITSIVGQLQSIPDIDGIEDLNDVDWGKVYEELDPQDLLKSLKSIVSSVKAIYGTIEMLQEIDIQDPEMATLGDQVFDYLLVNYLETHYGELYGFLKTFGVITSRTGDHGKPENIDLGAVVEAVEDPNEIPKELFNWAKSNEPFLATLLLQRLLQTFWGTHVPAKLSKAGEDTLAGATGKSKSELANLQPGDMQDTDAMDGWGQKLLLPLFGASYDGGQFETGLKLVPLPPKDGQFLPGVAVVTYGQLDSGMSGTLGDDWTASIEGDGHLANRGVAINPGVDSGLNFSFVNTEGSSAGTPGGESEDQLVFTADLEYVGGSESAQASASGSGNRMRKPIVGTVVGKISMDGLAVSSRFEYANDQFQFVAEFTTIGIISVDPKGGFLDKVIPKPIAYDFEVTLGWSTKQGFYLQNGGTLMISLADNLPLGPLQIKETFLGLDLGELGGGSGAGAPAIPTVFSSTPKLDIGFLTAEVMRTGIKADLSFPGGTDGNLGPADLDLGFKPPQGLALSVDAGPVSGGGMLRFFPEQHRYSGALQLSVGPLSLTAIGLLKTKLPGGGDGYSFLLLITAEFPPVQLGFGFTLNGVGGLFGLHRGMKTDVLGKKVRTGNVDSILFPENVIENAQQIISDLRAIFPPKKDVHVVGPMVKMGWGSPTLLTMEVGVILELPTFEIAIVGAFHLNLPDEDAPLITINLAVLGVLDPPDQRLAVTASLYDSRIVMWTVSGDMAMRLRWGDDAKFMLSVGGFHPRYEPPKGFPELDRVKASLGAPSGNPRIEFKGYLATTPNTFQVGAGVYLHAEAGPATVDGALAFDALFEFDPFGFVIDFLAKLKIQIKGHGLNIEVDGTMMGPGPMRIKGTVEIEILFISVTTKVDVKLGSGGETEELPRAKVMPKLTTELGKSANWAAQVPDSADSLVTIRDGLKADSESESGGQSQGEGDSGGDSAEVLAHPLGGIDVRQTVVPLQSRIEKFGNMVPRDYEQFRIADLQVDGTSLATDAKRERFAPAKYKKMKDSEKLNSPSFVEREAGRAAGSDACYFAGADEATSGRAAELRRTTKLEYETSVVDEREEKHAAPLSSLGRFADVRPERARFGIPLVEVTKLLNETALARSDLRQEFTTPEADVYGLPGGKVIGERADRTLPAGTVEEVQPAETVGGSGGDGTVAGGGRDGTVFDGESGVDAVGGKAIDEQVVLGESAVAEQGELLREQGAGVINIGGSR